MPKLLVLFQPHGPEVVRLAEAVADGARLVRFAEVDLRRPATSDAVGGDTSGRATRPLAHAHDIAAYDGLVLVVDGSADAGAALVQALGAFDGSLLNKVGCVLSSAEGNDRNAVLWSLLTSMADRGMILVPAPFDDRSAGAESARRAGTRLAEVIGWVTHARSHHHHEPHAPRDEPHHHH